MEHVHDARGHGARPGNHSDTLLRTASRAFFGAALNCPCHWYLSGSVAANTTITMTWPTTT
jgi:hypothetical protein